MKNDTPERDEAPKMRDTNDDERAIHQLARRRFSAIMDKERDEREQSRDDRRFYSVAGAQYDGEFGEQFENKPKLEVNKVSLAIIKIFSAFRKNPITAKFIARDGSGQDDLADICGGLYRSDEQDSIAQEAYDNAFEEGTSGGIGAWRLATAYEDPDDEDDDRQRIMLEPIHDADQHVFFDPNARRYDKSDAQYAFVLTPWTRESYRDEYGEDPATWQTEIQKSDNFDWATDDSVWIAEYFAIEAESRTLVFFKDALGSEHKHREDELTEEIMMELASLGATEVRSKKITVRTVMKYTMSGSQIIERPQRIAGKDIPIVPFYGKRVIVDNIERCSGMVRLAKDIQRLKNIQISRLAEIAAKSTVQKPIVTQEMVAGFEDEWADDPVEDYPYLRINEIRDANGSPIPAAQLIGYTKSPEIPPALAALYQMVEQDMKDLLGNQEGGEEIMSNVGKEVVEQIHARLDMQTFIFMSNMGKSVQRSAQIWLGMAREVYDDTNRTMKTVNTEEGTATVHMGTKETDIKKANYQVTTTVAPASASRKAAVVRNMVNMSKVSNDPELQRVIALTAAMNSEGEGTEGLRKFARKALVSIGVEEPTDEEQEEMQKAAQQEPPPDPAMVMAQAEMEKARADIIEAETRRMAAVADAKKKDTEVLSIIAKMEREDRDQMMKAMEKLDQRTASITEIIGGMGGQTPAHVTHSNAQ